MTAWTPRCQLRGAVRRRGGRSRHAGEGLDRHGAFIGFAEPLPSGTRIELRGDNHVQAARVDQVIESADPNAAGMHVSFVAPALPSTSARHHRGRSRPRGVDPTVRRRAGPEASPADSTGTTPPAHQGGGKRKRRR